VRDENYLIETFSFIYYSVSRRCHLAARTEARLATLKKSVSRMRARKCNVLSAHFVASIEKLSHSIVVDIDVAAARTMIISLNHAKLAR